MQLQNTLNLHEIILEDLDAIGSVSADWGKLTDKTLLVTGASGLIGYYICCAVLRKNDLTGGRTKVLALVRNQEKAREQFGEICNREDFRLIVQDVSASLEYKEKIDFIIHAASQASPRYFVSDPVGTILANTDGTKNMLNLAVENQAKLLYLSTREIYGSREKGAEFITEDEYGAIDPTLVRSCYPESKRLAETLCAAYSHQYGVKTNVARIAHTYGPDFTLDNGRVWGDFITAVVNRKNIIMKSEGGLRLSFSYISDIVGGLFLILLNGEDFAYNVANMKDIISIKELAEKTAGLFPEWNLSVELDIPKVSTGYLSNEVSFLDSGKLSKLGWNPEVDLESGLRRTILFHKARRNVNAEN